VASSFFTQLYRTLATRLKTGWDALFRPAYGQRLSPPGAGPYGSLAGPWASAWTDSRYEMVRHFRQWVYVAIDRIATAIAMNSPNVSYVYEDSLRVPPQEQSGRWLHKRREALDQRFHRYAWRSWHRAKALTPLQPHEDLIPVEAHHPLAQLLSDPNDPDTSYDLWYETTMYLLLTGNAYWWVPPLRSTGLPGAIWVLPSHWMVPVWNTQGGIEKYQLRPVEGVFSSVTIPATDVIHFRRKSPLSKHDGYGPLSAGASWVDTQEAMDRSRWHSFRNGISPA
jgi:hypothetical protein